MRAELAVRAMLLGYGAARAHEVRVDKAGVVRAVLPAGVSEVHLVSGAGFVPGDRRRLGALIRAITVDGRALELDDARLVRGFHAGEQHGVRRLRWTSGAGVIAIGDFALDREIRVDVAAVQAEAQAAQNRLYLDALA